MTITDAYPHVRMIWGSDGSPVVEIDGIPVPVTQFCLTDHMRLGEGFPVVVDIQFLAVIDLPQAELPPGSEARTQH